MSNAVEAALILLREGLEAILVLAALAALLRRLAPERIGALWGGAGLGLLASLATALGYILWRDGVHDDTVEGITCLIAAAFMLWTGGWLWQRSDPRGWKQALQRQAEAALAARRVAIAIGTISFLAVFREGAETILFLAAMAQDGGWGGILAGLLAASLGLAVLWVVLNRAAVRLPLGPLFKATSVFLLFMAARMVGAAIQEFQEQAMVGFDPAELPDWVVDIGVSPSWQGIAAQAAMLVLAGAVLLLARRAVPAAGSAPAAAE
ncbi:FTR1 family protein [Siccirubricoccus soli]|uniref:FTR1 family protein n=1 Tax=Siccirubricoccus soli TaxID=2899147 RepID=UPI00273A5AD7|nr:FTR1 family protein [Siccirubricoccus soli]